MATTNATCLPQFNWEYNAIGQSPCLVSAYLAASCSDNGEWFVPSLSPGEYYSPPSADRVSPCLCNTVTYSMVQGCGACQTAPVITTWTAWIQNCPISMQAKTFPYQTPSGTVVPNWAYLDPTIKGVWDPQAALAYATSASASINPISPSPTTFTPTLTTPFPTQSTTERGQTAGPTNTGTSKSTLIGAVVGGVLGAIVLVLLLVGVVWYFCMKDRRRPQPTAEGSEAGWLQQPSGPTSPYQPSTTFYSNTHGSQNSPPPGPNFAIPTPSPPPMPVMPTAPAPGHYPTSEGSISPGLYPPAPIPMSPSPSNWGSSQSPAPPYPQGWPPYSGNQM